jgi:hypothetical protein
VCCEQAGEGQDKLFDRLALSRALACTHAHMHLVEAIAAQVRHVGMVGEWVLGLACHSEAWRLHSQVRVLRTRAPFGATMTPSVLSEHTQAVERTGAPTRFIRMLCARVRSGIMCTSIENGHACPKLQQ